jgi:hypothetical protein
MFVKCKNPECGGEIKAPFRVTAMAAFSRVVNAEISCPYCRVTTTYSQDDFHSHAAPPAPKPMPTRSGLGLEGRADAPSGPSGPIPR